MRTSLIAACLLAVAALTAQAQQDIPAFDSYLADPAAVLDPQVIEPINGMLAQIAEGGSARIAVLSVADLQGEPAGQYALRALYEWPAGDGATRSALILIAPDGLFALATGGELLSRMSRDEAKAVLIENLLPTFEQSGLTQAIVSGTQALLVDLLTEEGGASGDPFAVVGRLGAAGIPELVGEDDGSTAAAVPDGGGFEIDPERWINAMTTALGQAAVAARNDPAAFLAMARNEANALPSLLDMEASRPTVPEQVVVRFILLGASLLLCVFVWRITHTADVLLGVVAVLAGLWIWQLSNFAELALGVMVAGALALPLLRLARLALRSAARNDNGAAAISGMGTGSAKGAPGPSQSYQEWLAAQRAKSPQRTEIPVVAKPAAAKASVKAAMPNSPMPAPPAASTPASARLPSGFIDNRSVPVKGAAAGIATKLAKDRERLQQAGVATPAIDQLLSSKAVLGGFSLRKLQIAAVGTFVAIAVFGPGVIPVLVIAAVLWGRSLWSRVKPAHQSSGDFLRQIAREAEAASKLRR